MSATVPYDCFRMIVLLCRMDHVKMGGTSVGKLTRDGSFEVENAKRMNVVFICFDVVDLRQDEKLFVLVQ